MRQEAHLGSRTDRVLTCSSLLPKDLLEATQHALLISFGQKHFRLISPTGRGLSIPKMRSVPPRNFQYSTMLMSTEQKFQSVTSNWIKVTKQKGGKTSTDNFAYLPDITML